MLIKVTTVKYLFMMLTNKESLKYIIEGKGNNDDNKTPKNSPQSMTSEEACGTLLTPEDR
jgi:hypothetical protein